MHVVPTMIAQVGRVKHSNQQKEACCTRIGRFTYVAAISDNCMYAGSAKTRYKLLSELSS